jgi:hypothetical protein
MRTYELHSEIVVFVRCNPQVAPRWYGSSVVAGPETGPFYYHGWVVVECFEENGCILTVAGDEEESGD